MKGLRLPGCHRASRADQMFFAACSSARFNFASGASMSSAVAQPSRGKQSLSCVRFVGWRPVQRAITRHAMIAQEVWISMPFWLWLSRWRQPKRCLNWRKKISMVQR